jgi:hypothetical protein
MTTTGRPPDSPALMLQEVKLWESGLLQLTPDEIVSARNIQQMVVEQSVELIFENSFMDAIGSVALNKLLQESTQAQPVPTAA